jgi:D-lactate dehydrogenase (cytochrome)
MSHSYNPVSPEIIELLTQIVGAENISMRAADLEARSNDQGIHPPQRAEVLVWVHNEQQVSQVMALANQQRIPVTAWGAGTSLEGNPIPLLGGIQLSFERMNRILAVHEGDFQVTVQPGIGYKDLNAQLQRYGLFFAPDPGANASIGGMLANNAAGIRTVKYGATRDNVLRMQVVLADGSLMRLGSRSIKQSSGYDLAHLVIGSEGTLAMITEATLKLAPIPSHFSAAIASFNSVSSAIEAVVAVRGSGLEPAALEFLDPVTTALISDSDGLNLPEKPTVLMEFHSAHQGHLQATLDSVREICAECGSVYFFATTNQSERLKLWHARHHTYETIVRASPGRKVSNSDVAVPISAYPTLIDFIETNRRERGVSAYSFGHAGDGNIHVLYVYAGEQESAAAWAMNTAVVYKAIELGGTATGEHGIGLGKTQFMQSEHGQALQLMRVIKQALDPNWILNPGKIFAD